ncbi:hypothetical protein [Eisenibacter elegans]|jgi:hypothetical protein|uniref:hypothetical protein n=1 Tax=Eisenibacter elegans TaxID=997 RepID=UPI000424E33E|nr:hypothetical protein [Eisenibacter elegans]
MERRTWLRIDFGLQLLVIATQALLVVLWVATELVQRPFPLLLILALLLLIPLGIYQMGISAVLYFSRFAASAGGEVKRWRRYHLVAAGLALVIWVTLYTIEVANPNNGWAFLTAFLALWMAGWVGAYATYVQLKNE